MFPTSFRRTSSFFSRHRPTTKNFFETPRVTLARRTLFSKRIHTPSSREGKNSSLTITIVRTLVPLTGPAFSTQAIYFGCPSPQGDRSCNNVPSAPAHLDALYIHLRFDSKSPLPSFLSSPPSLFISCLNTDVRAVPIVHLISRPIGGPLNVPPSSTT